MERLAEINENHLPEKLLFWTTKIASRYMGKDLAENYGKRNGVVGEMLVKIKPIKVNGQMEISI